MYQYNIPTQNIAILCCIDFFSFTPKVYYTVNKINMGASDKPEVGTGSRTWIKPIKYLRRGK